MGLIIINLFLVHSKVQFKVIIHFLPLQLRLHPTSALVLVVVSTILGQLVSVEVLQEQLVLVVLMVVVVVEVEVVRLVL